MMARVRKTDGCWLFEGALDDSGHGNVRVKRGDRWTCDKAHRISFREHKGEILKKMVVRHTCDVGNCVNPEHLILGSQADNVRDMVMRDRLANQFGPCTGFVETTPEFDSIPF
jgi:hypothetical protein